MTKEATLVNSEGRVTLHKFVRNEPATVEVVYQLADESIVRRESTGVAQIFACTETGVERRWGIR